MSIDDSEENASHITSSAYVSVEGVRLEIEGCRQTVYRVMLRYCGNPSDAEDLTQEAILKSLQSAHLYRGRARVCTWVVTIATYVYLTKVRKRVPPLTGILGHSETKSTMLEEVGALECVGGIRHEKDPHSRLSRVSAAANWRKPSPNCQKKMP
jgi:DNA-directed RNA polymerase specialized sigma24 family protein